MRILLVNTYDQQGGAARATWRLFKGLERAGVDVKLLVQNRGSRDIHVISTGGKITRYFNAIRPYIDFAFPLPLVRKRILFSTSFLPDGIEKIIRKINPDIIHLNWIAGGMIRIESLARLSKPVVWTFHDLWAFTGGCHYPPDCTRYMEQCGHCPVLHSTSDRDLSRWVFNRKKEAYNQMGQFFIISPSNWLADCVKSSTLLKNNPVSVIPNGLDTTVFKPMDKNEVRQLFHLPADKKLILFGGIRGVEYKLKGFSLLLEALRLLDPSAFELVVFGSSRIKNSTLLPLKTHVLGFIGQENKLASLYATADVVVVPSYQEVFGQTATEALSCGIPVVAFDSTGLKDIIDHQVNGYLATPYEPAELARGIEWILDDPERYGKLSENAREKALEKFDIGKITDKILTFYPEVLRKRL